MKYSKKKQRQRRRIHPYPRPYWANTLDDQDILDWYQSDLRSHPRLKRGDRLLTKTHGTAYIREAGSNWILTDQHREKIYYQRGNMTSRDIVGVEYETKTVPVRIRVGDYLFENGVRYESEEEEEDEDEEEEDKKADREEQRYEFETFWVPIRSFMRPQPDTSQPQLDLKHPLWDKYAVTKSNVYPMEKIRRFVARTVSKYDKQIHDYWLNEFQKAQINVLCECHFAHVLAQVIVSYVGSTGRPFRNWVKNVPLS
jgi:hypothetical protein